jgi:putative Mn2+ efflux pump MntP
MLLELFGFYGLMLLAMFFFADASKAYPLGIIGGVLLIVLGLGVLTDGLQVQSGVDTQIDADTTTNTTITRVNNDTTTEATLSTTTSTEGSSFVYSNISAGTLNINILGMVLCLLGLYAMWHFLMKK